LGTSWEQLYHQRMHGRAVAAFLNLYVSHGSATRFLRDGEKCYICFIANLAYINYSFAIVKEFS